MVGNISLIMYILTSMHPMVGQHFVVEPTNLNYEHIDMLGNFNLFFWQVHNMWCACCQCIGFQIFLLKKFQGTLYETEIKILFPLITSINVHS